MKTTLSHLKAALPCCILFCAACSVFKNEVYAASSIVLTNVVALTQGGLALEAVGTVGMVFSLQKSADLREWRTLDFVEAESGHASFQDASAPGAHARFYRVRQESPNTTTWLTNYHGWSNSIVIGNGTVQAAVVPAIGRIMQFRFSNSTNGPFFENASMFGKPPAANSWDTPGSFGGDKVWPAPQSVWNWPPPRGFDSLSFKGEVANGTVVLTGPVDSSFGTRVVRRITLHPSEPILRVSSIFEKLTGKTNQMSVWVVTQVNDAERVFVPVPVESIFPKGYTALGAIPKGLMVTNGLVAIARDLTVGSKIGTDAGAILWVGTDNALLIESARMPGVLAGGYPDSGCSAEVYTNPNPTPYIELEVFGPLAALGPGNTLEATSVYTLFRRTGPNALDEATRILGQ